MSVSNALAPKRKRSGLSQRVPSSSYMRYRYSSALFALRMPPAGLLTTGYAIGFKPAGGIRSAKTALEYLYLMKEELGNRWLRADLFRFGASALLTDIERQLQHFMTGRYAASHKIPMP